MVERGKRITSRGGVSVTGLETALIAAISVLYVLGSALMFLINRKLDGDLYEEIPWEAEALLMVGWPIAAAVGLVRYVLDPEIRAARRERAEIRRRRAAFAANISPTFPYPQMGALPGKGRTVKGRIDDEYITSLIEDIVKEKAETTGTSPKPGVKKKLRKLTMWKSRD
jgi:hypothetical protein